MTTRNITKTFRLVSESDFHDGMAWYARARALALELSPDDVDKGAGVIAALSPMNSWPRNLVLAREVFAGQIPATLYKNSAKAVRIYNGEPALDVLSGPKVVSFFLNIMGVECAESVTIDRHAIDIACGRVQSDIDRAKAIAGKNGYQALVNEYIRAAKILSKETGGHISGAQLQAIVWVYWRRNVIKNNHGDE